LKAPGGERESCVIEPKVEPEAKAREREEGPLRVAYVLASTAGGTGRHAAMLATGCADAGCQVRMLGPAALAPALTAGGDGRVEFRAVTIAARPRPGHDVAAIRRLRRLLADAEPDVVHAHGLRAGALTALALRPAPPALIVTVHNAPPAAAWAALVYAVLERVVARRADAVLCVSADLEARMRRRGARAVERAVVPSPLPAAGHRLADPSPSPAELAGPVPSAAELAGPVPSAAELAATGRPVVLAAGRLTAQKGLDTLLAAAATEPWREWRPVPLVVIAGTGPLARALAGQARDLGVEAAFLGWRADVASLLAACTVFVLPSRWEGQPLIVQEALRAGRPIVASDVGGVHDLTGNAALLVPPGDAAALAAAVLRVLGDDGLAARLAAAATERAATLPTEAAAVAAALALYQRLA
jgi:glycosyltransferase involved in cell wall biosynthesis